jgi:hypothetical protein
MSVWIQNLAKAGVFALVFCPLALSLSACTTQVGFEEEMMQEDREDEPGPDAKPRAPRPDATPIFDGPCGQGEADAFFVTQDGVCFEYFYAADDWEGAQAHCQTLYGDLAKIDDEVDNGVLASLVPNAFPIAWVRGTDAVSEGTWTWDGPIVTYKNWRPGEPSNGLNTGEEDCMVLEGNNGGLWDDRPCSAEHSFICERPNPGP